MYAFRSTWQIKFGGMDKALELLRETPHIGTPGLVTDSRASARVYTPDISPDLLIFEESWEDLEARDVFWADFNGKEAAADWWRRWNELVDRHVSSERWTVTVLSPS
jgi:hypothetical protein